MATHPYDPRADWPWPKESGGELPNDKDTPIPGSFVHEKPERPRDVPHTTNRSGTVPKPRKHYPPRTCRICLEVVLPTFEPSMEGITSILNPAPRVSYISSDPESGRLIRPCKCIGSQKYVHVGCLQAWRHADPSYGRRNYWECPTCKFRYRLERLRWGRWISSTFAQVILTVAILFFTIFIFGFVADPIINLYLDPYDTITSLPRGGPRPIQLEDGEFTWTEHFVKGLASLGLLGFVKAFFAMSPWTWWNLRQTGIIGGGGRGRGTGRDRLENISWTLVIIGVITFLYAVWKFVRAWCRRTLEKAGERVADVQGTDDGDNDETEPEANSSAGVRDENRKTQ
ncbi:hypothetical protein B7494_g7580 [Chlorociboria aeruginascens]|nr:hypothetical protein B7494_g7580 [Chlorociboria aeruginascens]